ncbi:glycosyltransferase family 4 protein [Thalassobacillus devorans]|uniref:glycosyltransferase family 4 protein n=1 Tax=Thalassobacillus devorans TaxID=279813 RepID=UPI00048E1DE2|nr:glycosyltransferase family 1 protein [Thalassobacillus devorans]
MKVYINGRFLTQRITGVQRFAREILISLDRLKNSKIKFILVIPENITCELELENIMVVKYGKTKGHLWEQFDLRRFTRNKLLLNLCNTSPILKKKQLTVIHDMAVFATPQNFSRSFQLFYKMLFKSNKFSKNEIITISNFSRNEISKYLKIKEDRIHVIIEGKEQIKRINSDNAIIEKYKLKNKEFVLAVSSMNPNKNFKVITRAADYFSKNIPLVIAGGNNFEIFKKTNFSKVENVLHVGYVTDEQLKALYENALCFIYPSYYEGFGLPPIEAMATGCPVIVSDQASLPEVCGDAAEYIAPDDAHSLSKTIKKLYSDPHHRNLLIEKGNKQSNKFTWELAGKQIYSLIEKRVINESSGRT